MASRRKATQVNASVPEGERGNVTQTELADAVTLAAEDLVRQAGQAQTELMEETMTSRQVDANRDVPRTRRPTSESSNRYKRELPAANTKRAMTSSRRKKDYSRHKNEWQRNLPKVRAASLNAVVGAEKGGPDKLEEVNNALREVVGRRSRLDPKLNRHVHRMDMAIADYERGNERQHLVYSVMRKPDGMSHEAFRENLARVARAEGSYTFDAYIPATHNLGTLPDGDDVVMEIQTYSGAYLGGSDSTPDADHLVGRGRRLQPVGVQEVNYAKPDGSTGRRWVVQMRDISEQDGN